MRVTGHFDDPAAKTCRINFGKDDTRQAPDRRAVVLYCRERFVMDRYEAIGAASAFPSG